MLTALLFLLFDKQYRKTEFNGIRREHDEVGGEEVVKVD